MLKSRSVTGLLVADGSNTVGHEPALGVPGENAAWTFTVIVKPVTPADN